MRVALAPACRACRPSSCWGSACFPTAKAPHFSRLGDVEVNAGQNASFQCMAAGRAAEAERFLLQVRASHADLAQEGSGGQGASPRLGSFGGFESSLHTPASRLLPLPGCALEAWIPLNPRAEGSSCSSNAPTDNRDSHTLLGWNGSLTLPSLFPFSARVG